MCRTAGQGSRVRHLPVLRVGEVRVMKDGKTQLPLPLEAPPRALPVLDERERGTRFLALPVRRVLNSPATTHMPFWSLNPYVGCEFGCSYCYARRTHEWTMERTEGRKDAFSSFEHDILVKQGAPEVLLRTLDPSRIGGTTVLIGTATDPYQPAERRFLLTRRLLEALLQHRGLSLGLITKSPLGQAGLGPSPKPPRVPRALALPPRPPQRHKLCITLSAPSTAPALPRRLEARSPAP